MGKSKGGIKKKVKNRRSAERALEKLQFHTKVGPLSWAKTP